MTSLRPVLVTAVGPPRDRTTWSSTPHNLIQALESTGRPVVAHDANSSLGIARALALLRFESHRTFTPSNLRSPASLLKQLRALNTETRSDYNWSAAIRRARGEGVLRAAAKRRLEHVIHMGSGTLPFPREDARSPVKHILVYDQTWHQMYQRPFNRFRYPPKVVAAFEALEREALEQVSGVVAIGQHVADDLECHYGFPRDRIRIGGSGFSLPPYHGPKDYVHGHIMFAAKMRWEEKGGELLVDAFRLARQHVKQLRLVMAGHDRYAERLAKEPGIKAYGHVSHEALRDLFARSRLFAMPALHEPWGLVYLDAMVNRTPILGLSRFAFPEFSKDGSFGFAAAAATPAAVADALVDAVSDPDRLARMGLAAQQHVVDTYSWTNLAAATSELIEA